MAKKKGHKKVCEVFDVLQSDKQPTVRTISTRQWISVSFFLFQFQGTCTMVLYIIDSDNIYRNRLKQLKNLHLDHFIKYTTDGHRYNTG